MMPLYHSEDETETNSPTARKKSSGEEKIGSLEEASDGEDG